MDITTSFNEQLAELHIFVEQMQATSSSLDKVEILEIGKKGIGYKTFLPDESKIEPLIVLCF